MDLYYAKPNIEAEKRDTALHQNILKVNVVPPPPAGGHHRGKAPATVTVNYACSDRYLVMEPGRATGISEPATFWCSSREKKEEEEKRVGGEIKENEILYG